MREPVGKVAAAMAAVTTGLWIGVEQELPALGALRNCVPESAENLRLMRKLDQLYMKLPFFGSRKMAVDGSLPPPSICSRRFRSNRSCAATAGRIGNIVGGDLNQ